MTITNNQAVALHPSSVNVGRRPRDFGVNYLSYFTIMGVMQLAKAMADTEDIAGNPSVCMHGRLVR